MAEGILASVLEYNNWANLRLIQACTALQDTQLDAKPQSATLGTIRETLVHLVAAQRGYLVLLTLPVDERAHAPLTFDALAESAALSGGGLLALTKEKDNNPKGQVRTTDGYDVEPWVVLVQVIQHAAEHREQVCSMLTALGIAPPELDGWTYGEASGALIQATA